MPGKKGGTAKPSDMLKKKAKDYDEVNSKIKGWLSFFKEKIRRRS